MTTYDLTIYKGETYSLSITLRDADSVPIDLTNYAISGFIKQKYSDSIKLVDLNPTKVVPFTGGGITLGVPATGTAAMPCNIDFYDVEISASGSVTKVLAGKVSVYPEITY